jgi:hypothetical protein
VAFDTFDTDPVPTTGITFSNGNLTALGGTTSLSFSAMAQTIEGKKAGKWYVEFTCNAVSGNVDGVGVTNSSAGYSGGFLGSDAGATWGYFTNGNVVNGNSAVGAVNNTTYGAGDVIGVAIDLDNNKIWWRKNTGSWIGTSGTPNPATNTSGFSATNLMANNMRAYPIVNNSGAAAKFTANFGAASFTGTVPSGFTSGWTNTTAGTYFGSFANTGHGGSSGNTSAPPANDKAVSKYTATLTGSVSSVIFTFNGSGANATKAVIYADSSGAPGALLSVSTNTLTGVGEKEFTFSGVSVTSGTAYWFGVVMGAGTSGINCPPLTNGILYNSGPSTAAPSNPFGTGTTANFRYPALIMMGISSPVLKPVLFLITALAALGSALGVVLGSLTFRRSAHGLRYLRHG